jgi:hypothetical protein
MSYASLEGLLTIEEIREILNQWSQRGFLRIRNLGTQIVIQDRTNYNCYTFRLTSEFEHRFITRETVPYRGEAIDSFGQPPGLWEVEVAPPRDFSEGSEHLPLPHTEEVEECRHCHGVGTENCSSCQGWGKVNCTWCQGSGWRTVTRPRTNSLQPNSLSPSISSTPSTETVRENCSHCFGGKVNCTWCSGSGRRTCSTCDGAGQVKHFDQLTVEFQVDKQEEVEYEGGLPEHLILRVAGETLCDQEGSRIETVHPINDNVDARLGDLLRQSQDTPSDTRLLFQHVSVERILVHRIAYNYQNDKVRELWIYGPDNLVHAPGAPWRWGLLLAWLAGVVLVLAVLIVLIAWAAS